MSKRKTLHPGFEQWRYIKSRNGSVYRMWRCQGKRFKKEGQCGLLASSGKNVCGYHGGYSNGRTTVAGKRAFALAKRTTCVGTNYAKDLMKRKSLEICCLEILGVLLGVISRGKLNGNKPHGYPWDLAKRVLDDGERSLGRDDLVRLLRLTYG